MVGIRSSTGCVNHPGIEAVARCRQCGKPVCGSCVVIGVTGKFCSEDCREKHAHFVESAQKLELEKGVRAGLFTRLKRWTVKLVMFAVALVSLGLVLTYLNILDIPFLRAIIERFL